MGEHEGKCDAVIEAKISIARLEEITKDIPEIKEDVKEIKQQLSGMKGYMAGISAGVSFIIGLLFKAAGFLWTWR